MNLSLKSWSLFILTSMLFCISTANAEGWDLPTKQSPRPETTNGIPHIQIGADPMPELSEQLSNRVAKITGVELRNTIVGRAGSTGFWVDEATRLTRPDSLIRGREFAHCHPDGSLHASLPAELALKAIEKGWAIHHPWAANKAGLEGFVMIYTPMTTQELDVVVQLVEESYRFVTTR